MKLTEQEKGMGLMIATCQCCGNVHKAHELSNSLAFGGIPNYGCHKCQGIPPKRQQPNRD